MPGSSRPLQLILARNLLSSLSTPAFLVSAHGELLFWNDAAGSMLGRRFEETGKLSAQEWTSTFGPFDDDGEPIPYDQVPITAALRGNHAAHAAFHIRSADGAHHEIEASGLPIVGEGGFHGAMVLFWPAQDGAPR